MFRYVTLIEPGWVKHLYLIDKSSNAVYRSSIVIPEMETEFYPKWQVGNKLIDFCFHDEEPYLIVLEKI